MQEVYIRINPRCKRQTSVVMGRAFEKRRNWYGPVDRDDPEVAKLLTKLETISDNDSNPHAGQPVFEIKEKKQAVATEKKEAEVADPRGTIDNPVPVPGGRSRSHTVDDVAAGDGESAPARRRRRSE